MFRRWRLTPLHRQRGCRRELLSSVCCHIGDFNFASDLSVCPNALPLAVLHRTNTRTLTMFTRFHILTTYPRLTSWHPIRLLA